MTQKVSKETVRLLVEGKLPPDEVRELLRLSPKDPDRFEKYLQVLQERVPWQEKILIRIADHLYVVRKDVGERVVKCDCGQEFGDYRINWKLNCVVRVRRTKEEFSEIYAPFESAPEPDWVEIREFYCPGCFALLSVEATAAGLPPLFEWLPDIDTAYGEWLGQPLKDESPEWFKDRTAELTSQWAKEIERG